MLITNDKHSLFNCTTQIYFKKITYPNFFQYFCQKIILCGRATGQSSTNPGKKMKPHIIPLNFFSKKSPVLFIVAATLTLVCLTACRRSGQPEWRTCEGAVWNTSFHIRYLAPASLDDSIQSVFTEINNSLSPFNPESAISRINRNESDITDPLINEVFSTSLAVNRASGRRFDPTVSPLVNLWGFGYEGKKHAGENISIDEATINNALSLVGIADCSISGYHITKKNEGTTFNFSAITKGYACDLIGEMMSRNGAENYMVEIGGEIALRGHNPKGEDWRIQIDAPLTDNFSHERLTVVSLTDCGVATSGNYRNYIDTGDHGRIAHTIDPSTGYPATSEILSATVVAATCELADALATACMATPSATEAMAMIKQFPGAKVLLVTSDSDSLKTVAYPPSFPY